MKKVLEHSGRGTWSQLSIGYLFHQSVFMLMNAIKHLDKQGDYVGAEVCVRLLGGGLAGVTATSITYLLDLVRTCLAAQGQEIQLVVGIDVRDGNDTTRMYVVPVNLFKNIYLTPATLQIDHDLPRTFPCHPWLDNPEGQASLRRVLVGYSFRDAEVGYCQDLNYVAALLLLVMKTEEDAFWMLAVLLENVLVSDCYTDNLSGCHVEQRVFKDLLAKKCPRIAAHLEAIEFDVSLVATEWFLCLFSKSLPSEEWEYMGVVAFFWAPVVQLCETYKATLVSFMTGQQTWDYG